MNLNITENKYNLKLDDLVLIGKRVNNKKRNFLFISKLLGKHLIVRADTVKAIGVLLSSLKYKEINNKNIINYIKDNSINIKKDLNQQTKKDYNVLVIGFEETATGLGMSVASTIKGCTYQTTTREPIVGMKNLLSFEEEHSHATTHQCFSLLDTSFSKYDEIILVDDEITTGNTILNLILDITKKYNVKKFSIFSILDWRNEKQLKKYKLFQKEHNITISVYSLLSGIIQNINSNIYQNTTEIEITEKIKTKEINQLEKVNLLCSYHNENKEFLYFKHSGRFGVSQNNIISLEEKCANIAKQINYNKKDKILVIGHGANIYIPSRVASYMNADFKTTTRSPIYCDKDIIKTCHYFIDKDVKYYFYNKDIIEEKYNKIILLTEQSLPIQLCKNMESIVL